MCVCVCARARACICGRGVRAHRRRSRRRDPDSARGRRRYGGAAGGGGGPPGWRGSAGSSSTACGPARAHAQGAHEQIAVSHFVQPRAACVRLVRWQQQGGSIARPAHAQTAERLRLRPPQEARPHARVRACGQTTSCRARLACTCTPWAGRIETGVSRAEPLQPPAQEAYVIFPAAASAACV